MNDESTSSTSAKRRDTSFTALRGISALKRSTWAGYSERKKKAITGTTSSPSAVTITRAVFCAKLAISRASAGPVSCSSPARSSASWLVRC